MVRIIISALSVCGAYASESGVLMQSQAQADGTLVMLGANDQFANALQAGSGRVRKMQENTKQMEDQYRALLQNIVSSGSMANPETGKPWLPSQDFLTVVKDQFTALKTELLSEKSQNEGILEQAHNNVVQCNTARKSAFDATDVGVKWPSAGVLALQSTMQGARTTHSTCRNGEDVDITDMEGKCAAFDDLASKCDENQDWYAQYNDANIAATAANTLQTVVAKATACKGAVDTVTTTAAQCDTDQTAFKQSFCAYEHRLDSVCVTHHSCYELQTRNLDTTNSSVAALEIEQKTIWRMVGKVECYLTALVNAGATSMPTQATITSCSGTPIADSDLTITYNAVAAEDECMKNNALREDYAGLHAKVQGSNYRPGDELWYHTEMAGLTTHNKLNDNVACGR